MEVSVDQEVVVVAKGSARTKKSKKKKYKKEDLQKALMMVQSNKMSRLAASKIYKVPLMTIENKMKDPINQFDLLPAITQFNRVSTMDVENNDNSDELMNNSINYGIFPNDNSGNLTPTPDKGNENKFAKLAAKMRLDVKELGDLCPANENENMNVVMTINQQLTLFDPPNVTDNIAEHNTIKSILKQPGMPQRVNPKRNLKVSFAVLKSREVTNQVKERETDPKEDKIAKNVRKLKIVEVGAELREARKMLNVLRTEHSSKIKEAAQKKQLKIHANDGVDLGAQERRKKIKEKVDQVRQLRELLKSLKKDHIAANNTAAIKRRNVLMSKRKKD